MDSARVLVVDDDKAVRTALQVNLTKSGLDVVTLADPTLVLSLLTESTFDLVMTDVQMPGMNGMELLSKVKEVSPDTAVIVMTGYGSVQDAVQAMRNGAADYIIKPVQKAQLLFTIERALESRALKAELVRLRRNVQDMYGFESLIGTSPKMVALYEMIASIAETEATVLLQGPTGTGKELMANAIHFRSRRSDRPFVRVNCAAIPESLLESELFGHEKGAFTGAIRQHRGRFEQAHNGTILLDEIGEIPLHIQVKLLRALENGEIQRVGGSETVHVDVRIIAATNINLREASSNGTFRSDLYYRLNVVTLAIPPLKERTEDIPLLADHFIKIYTEKNNRMPIHLTDDALQKLMNHSWPGNVRELEHVIERAIILGSDDSLHLQLPETEPTHTSEPPPQHVPLPIDQTLQEALHGLERDLIIRALKQYNGIQAQAARQLGVSRSNLNYRIQKLGIELQSLDYK